MNWLRNKKVKVAVHDGYFHADDIFAVAILSLYLDKSIEIFRTRDEEIYKKMDYLLDVGREYDPVKNKFDHHQQGGAGKRENSIPYASCGLVWKEFGEKISGSKEVAGLIDQKIIQTVDAEDSGISIHKRIFNNIDPYYFIDYIISLNPGPDEKGLDSLQSFEEAVKLVKKMIKREVKITQDYIFNSKKVREVYERSPDKRLIILDCDFPWRDIIKKYQEPLIVVRPVINDWWASCVPVREEKFVSRIKFPSAWSGKVDEELARITGVDDAVFCHKDLFMCSAKSREGAIRLAQLALNKK